MLYPLSDLRDPFAFLNGARVPLRSTTSEEAEWIADDVFYRICDSYERGFLCIRLDEDTERPTGIDPNLVHSLSLDLSEPDVSRWVDRKIAGIIYPDVIAATIIARGSREGFGIACLRASETGVGTFTGPLAVPLVGIPCDDANIPTARAALVRALFGKVPA